MNDPSHRVAEFIELRSAADKLPAACERTATHFEGGRTVCIYAPDPGQAAELDALLWTFRQNAFIPHVRLETAEDEPVEPVLILGRSPDAAEADVLILLCSGEMPPWFERFHHVYDFAEVHDAALRQAARLRFAACKAAGYRMRFIKA